MNQKSQLAILREVQEMSGYCWRCLLAIYCIHGDLCDM